VLVRTGPSRGGPGLAHSLRIVGSGEMAQGGGAQMGGQPVMVVSALPWLGERSGW
jgi:hypothetical protein